MYHHDWCSSEEPRAPKRRSGTIADKLVRAKKLAAILTSEPGPTIDGIKVKQVRSAKMLDSYVSNDGSEDDEMSHRKRQASIILRRFYPTFKEKQLSRQARIRGVAATVGAVLLVNCAAMCTDQSYFTKLTGSLSNAFTIVLGFHDDSIRKATKKYLVARVT